MFTKTGMIEAIKEAQERGCDHYVYGLLRGDSGRIFYIGKGVNDRVFDHEKNASLNSKANPHKNAIIKKHGVGGYVLFSAHASDKEAFGVERDLIAQYGIENLANIGRGGEGQDPEFARQFAKQQWADPNSKIRQAISTDEHKAKLSIASKEAQNRPEVKAKRAASLAKVMPQIAAKLRENYKNPAARYAAGNGNRGRVQPITEREKRAASVRVAYADPSIRARHSIILTEISNRPEMKLKRSEASKVRWAPSATERAAKKEFLEKARADRKIKQLINAEKRLPKYATKEEARAVQTAALRKANLDPKNIEAKRAAAKKLHADPIKRAALSAARTKQAAIVRVQRQAYCAQNGILNPGKNYCNINKAEFAVWLSSNSGDIK